VYTKNPSFKIPLVNRLAKLEAIIDWESDSGKLVKKVRKESGKWLNLPSEDCKYIFSIYYHELKGRRGEVGVVERGVPLFSKDPKTELPFFVKVPEWILQQILKKCESFNVVSK